jgi:hypothetical protein
MAMQINFQSKEESNKKQLEDFLNLSKQERIYFFYQMILKSKSLPQKKISKETNFCIEINCK